MKCVEGEHVAAFAMADRVEVEHADGHFEILATVDSAASRS